MHTHTHLVKKGKGFHCVSAISSNIKSYHDCPMCLSNSVVGVTSYVHPYSSASWKCHATVFRQQGKGDARAKFKEVPVCRTNTLAIFFGFHDNKRKHINP